MFGIFLQLLKLLLEVLELLAGVAFDLRTSSRLSTSLAILAETESPIGRGEVPSTFSIINLGGI